MVTQFTVISETARASILYIHYEHFQTWLQDTERKAAFRLILTRCKCQECSRTTSAVIIRIRILLVLHRKLTNCLCNYAIKHLLRLPQCQGQVLLQSQHSEAQTTLISYEEESLNRLAYFGRSEENIILVAKCNQVLFLCVSRSLNHLKHNVMTINWPKRRSKRPKTSG